MRRHRPSKVEPTSVAGLEKLEQQSESGARHGGQPGAEARSAPLQGPPATPGERRQQRRRRTPRSSSTIRLKRLPTSLRRALQLDKKAVPAATPAAAPRPNAQTPKKRSPIKTRGSLDSQPLTPANVLLSVDAAPKAIGPVAKKQKLQQTPAAQPTVSRTPQSGRIQQHGTPREGGRAVEGRAPGKLPTPVAPVRQQTTPARGKPQQGRSAPSPVRPPPGKAAGFVTHGGRPQGSPSPGRQPPQQHASGGWPPHGSGGQQRGSGQPQRGSAAGAPSGKPPAGAGAPSPAAKVARCDKCDGKHATAACPHFRKARETHPDAQRGGKSGLGGLGGTPTRSSNPRLVADPAMVGCSRLAAPASGRQAACR